MIEYSESFFVRRSSNLVIEWIAFYFVCVCMETFDATQCVLIKALTADRRSSVGDIQVCVSW